MPDYEGMRRLSVDPRMVQEIQRSPSMRAEQGADFMQGWGGPEQYQMLARMPVPERLTYVAVSEGYTEPSEIEVVTGLTSGEVSGALADLRRRKLIAVEALEALEAK